MNQQQRDAIVHWSLGDVVDLEYFVAMDDDRNPADLARRDRDLFVNRICAGGDSSAGTGTSLHVPCGAQTTDLPARGLIHRWLQLRRETSVPSPLLPGVLFQDTLSLLFRLAILAGGMTGFGLVGSFFTYTGARPLNVSWFLYLTLLVPLVFLVMSAGGAGLALTGSSRFRFPRIQRLTAFGFQGLARWLKKRTALADTARGQREALAEALGIARARHQVYGTLFFWPLFMVAQLFALGFYAGVLGTTLARVFFSDVAFGWQSSLKVGPALVHQLVSLVSLPWSWLLPAGVAHPTLDQIMGSRIVLKDGMYHLATADLVSWWPFLCLCILFYGVFPRLVLLLAGMKLQRRALDRIPFDHAPCQALMRRMTLPRSARDDAGPLPNGGQARQPATAPDPSFSPGVPGGAGLSFEEAGKETDEETGTTQKGTEISGRVALEKTAMDAEETEGSGQAVPGAVAGEFAFPGALVLIPDELDTQVDGEELNRHLRRQCGVVGVKQMMVDMDAAPPLFLKTVADLFSQKSPAPTRESVAAIVWLQEAWQPPIRETLSLIKALGRDVGDGKELIVVLVGRPGRETLFTAPSPVDYRVWRQKLNALGDPRLRITPLVMEERS